MPIIAKLDLRQGDAVFVEKGGEIIPKIGADREAGGVSDLFSQVITFPSECPACGTMLVRKEGEAQHYCPNTAFVLPKFADASITSLGARR